MLQVTKWICASTLIKVWHISKRLSKECVGLLLNGAFGDNRHRCGRSTQRLLFLSLPEEGLPGPFARRVGSGRSRTASCEWGLGQAWQNSAQTSPWDQVGFIQGYRRNQLMPLKGHFPMSLKGHRDQGRSPMMGGKKMLHPASKRAKKIIWGNVVWLVFLVSGELLMGKSCDKKFCLEIKRSSFTLEDKFFHPGENQPVEQSKEVVWSLSLKIFKT